jgi:hypothetical protein
MISIVDPEAVGQVLRPTVYRATESKVDPSDERREPPKTSAEPQRVRDRPNTPAGVV